MADNTRFLQVQPYFLTGAGVLQGGTAVTLTKMTQIDGTTPITMLDFGSKGFATIEPGNGTREEQIVFTGITQNADGTADLTGVSNVNFHYPYTETSGVSRTHPGATTLVISNTSGFYNRLVAKDDDETIAGTWTFTNPNYPTMDTASPLPTLQPQLATKAYVDSVALLGAPNATTSVQGMVQLPTQAQVDAGTATGSTGASLTPTPALLRSKLLSDYVVDTGVADAYVITPSPAITGYAAGQSFTWKAAHTNTTTSTIAINGLATKTIKKLDGATNLAAGDIVAGQIIQIEYDGTNFQMLSPGAAQGLPAISSGNINEFVTTTDGSAFSMGRPFNYQAFTGNGTWTKPTNLSGNELVLVQMWGGGGAGGGVTTATGTGGGGGGGAYVSGNFRASDLTSTVTVTVGAVTAGTNNAANAGNSSTFGTYLTAYGGGGGSSGNSIFGGGGGGGGTLGVGASTTTATGAVGGSPAGGAANSDSGFGGGGGATGATGGRAVWGGGGGGARTDSGNAGGNSFYGGGGGAGGETNGSANASTSVFGGGGGAGATSVGVGSAGTAPGGGGGGARAAGGSAAGGDGARGEVRVYTFL